MPCSMPCSIPRSMPCSRASRLTSSKTSHISPTPSSVSLKYLTRSASSLFCMRSGSGSLKSAISPPNSSLPRYAPLAYKMCVPSSSCLCPSFSTRENRYSPFPSPKGSSSIRKMTHCSGSFSNSCDELSASTSIAAEWYRARRGLGRSLRCTSMSYQRPAPSTAQTSSSTERAPTSLFKSFCVS